FSRSGRHTRFSRDWSSDVCSSDLVVAGHGAARVLDLGVGGQQRVEPEHVAQLADAAVLGGRVGDEVQQVPGQLARRIDAETGLRSEEHTSELQSREKIVCSLLLEK